MNNRDEQSATGSRSAETYVLDLTSVCVRSGTVRLPLSLLGRFAEGEHAAVADGEVLNLRFEAPRTLYGLTPFFERHELKPNDRVRFAFQEGRLELHALRRDRSRGSARVRELAAGSEPPQRQSPGSPAAHDVPARRNAHGVSSKPAEKAKPDPAREGVPASARAEAGGAAANEGPAEAPRENSVSAVRRVRIEGGTPPRTDTPAPNPIDRASARDVWARRQQPSWRSLDTTIAGPVVPPEEAAEAFSDATVRVIRRSKGTSTPLEVESPAPATPTPERKAPVSYSTSWPLAERPLAGTPRAEASASAPPEATKRAALDPYLDAPIDVDREDSYASNPTILESDLLAIPANGGKWRDESEQAYLQYQEGAEGERASGPRDRRQGLLGRLGLTRGAQREESARRGAQEARPGMEERRQPAPVAVPRGRSDGSGQKAQGQPLRTDVAGESGGNGIGISNWPRSSALIAEPATPAETAVQLEAVPEASAEPRHGSAAASNEAPPGTATAAGATPQPRVIVDESVYDVDFDTEVQQPPAGSAGATNLENDMARLRGYLDRPDVPAIVRCDDLAVKLSLSQERVTHAMSRLAEDRDRFTPLRGNAYMIRRVR